MANFRIHGSLKERPAERFEAELPHLLPPAPWPHRAVAPRRVDRAGKPAGGADTSPVVDVERHPLTEYARINGGAS
ncbi:MAG: hypothetical protein J4F34_07855 [Gemmatimonadetes bacterium]|nr:hypothetical protein [Gemmatimonadota bacterium]